MGYLKNGNDLEVSLLSFFNEHFGCRIDSRSEWSQVESRSFIYSLLGPAYTVCPLDYIVKDIRVDKCPLYSEGGKNAKYIGYIWDKTTQEASCAYEKKCIFCMVFPVHKKKARHMPSIKN